MYLVEHSPPPSVPIADQIMIKDSNQAEIHEGLGAGETESCQTLAEMPQESKVEEEELSKEEFLKKNETTTTTTTNTLNYLLHAAVEEKATGFAVKRLPANRPLPIQRPKIFLRIKKAIKDDSSQSVMVSSFKEPFGPLMMEMENRPWHSRIYSNRGQSWAEYLEGFRQRTEELREKAQTRAAERQALSVADQDTLFMFREGSQSYRSFDESCNGNSTSTPSESNHSSPALLSSKEDHLDRPELEGDDDRDETLLFNQDLMFPDAQEGEEDVQNSNCIIGEQLEMSPEPTQESSENVAHSETNKRKSSNLENPCSPKALRQNETEDYLAPGTDQGQEAEKTDDDMVAKSVPRRRSRSSAHSKLS
jgi:hypothetical protein